MEFNPVALDISEHGAEGYPDITAFMDDPDRVLTRQELLARVWDRLDTTFRVVDAYVSRLRTNL